MALRRGLVAIIVLATVGFVVGTSLERNQSRHESAATLKSEGTSSAGHSEGNGESPAAHTAETGAAESSKTGVPATHAELRPLGINIEAVPFVVLAALASLALALAAWLRPTAPALLLGAAVAMLLFAMLDVREVFHQSDEARTGLAVLAGAVALLHTGAAAAAGLMASRTRSASRRLGGAGTMPS